MDPLSQHNTENSIIFFAEKIHVHHWPLTSPNWNNSTKNKVDINLNKNKEKKKIIVTNNKININGFHFDKIKKVGITVPLFKKQTTLVFEGHFEDFDAHIHVTTSSENYLDIFNNLMSWKTRVFPDSF